MKRKEQGNGVQTKEQIQRVEALLEKTKTQLELAERRTELAETRTELAETRTALAETRAEQVETVLQRVMTGTDACCKGEPQLPANGSSGQENRLEHLTSRQREVLQHIAEGRNTKEIGDILGLSPKTVEYHRAMLMRALDVHDIPALVRLAVHAGLVPAEA